MSRRGHDASVVSWGSLAALVLLTFQTSATNLAVKASRLHPARAADGAEIPYAVGTTVVLPEIVKMAVALLLSWATQPAGPASKRSTRSLAQRAVSLWPVVVPALAYTVQNILAITGSGRMPSAVAQSILQLKILTSASFSRLMLGKRISAVQWLSLVGLVGGVAMVTSSGGLSLRAVGPWQAAASGALLLLGAALLSGFAGAWTERLLKQAVGPEEESWWAKNARLSAMSVPLALLCTLVVDLQHLRRSGFFSGYTAWTWAVVALQAAAGLLTAVVIRRTNQIVKNFASAGAVVVTLIAAHVAFGDPITAANNVGVAIVAAATLGCGFGGAPQTRAGLTSGDAKDRKGR